VRKFAISDIHGNHEEMMIRYLDGVSNMWLHYGGVEAANSINKVFKKEGVAEIIQWVRTLPLVFEDETYLFAHAGISNPYIKEQVNREDLWIEKDDFYEIEKKTLRFY